MADIQPSRAVRPPPMPQFSLKRDKHVSRIQVAKWSIAATKRPILNGKEIESAEKRLKLPLPEMTFGNNSLVLSYDPDAPSSSATGAAGTSSGSAGASGSSQTIRFDAMESLEGVATGEGWEERVGGGVKVSMAEKWNKNSRRNSPSLLSDQPLPSKPVRPHDWTYSTCYAGSSSGPAGFNSSPDSSIPMSLLARRDPILDQILYYEDVPLFEDELHDNGESILNARIRVMPHSFFILARLFVRVDNVLFRIHDVRVYHAFGSEEVIREVSGMEVDYNDVKNRLLKPEDLSPLTDQNWVSETMNGILASRIAKGDGEVPVNKPWPGLGKRVEVLKLSTADAGSAQEGMEKLSLS